MADTIQGVFVVEKQSKIGTGHTKKKVDSKMYCLAKQISENVIEFRYLGPNDQPIGEPEQVTKEEFVQKFTFQPYYFERKKVNQEAEKERLVNKDIAKAEEHAKRNELHSAEFEYKNALKLDEENLKANFGIGNVYLKMGERDKAKQIFSKISKIEAIFEEKNKHFFNDCGIQLRKQELYGEAIDYYDKAIKLSPDDENLLFNLARPHCEAGNYDKAREVMYKALAVNPNFKEGKALLNYIDKKEEESPPEETEASREEGVPAEQNEGSEKTEAAQPPPKDPSPESGDKVKKVN